MLQGLSAIPAVLAAVVVRTDRRLVARLEAAGAGSASTAVRLVPRGPLARWRLARLEGVGAIRRHPTTGALYLDAAGWAAYRWRRRRRALVVLAVVLPVAMLLAWLTTRPPA